MAYFDCIVGSNGSGGVTLTVICDSNFAGSTITCTDGTTTLTEACPSSSPYTVEFEIPNVGTWTISGIVSGTTFSTTVDIPSSVELHTVPDGSTVTPVNDIQIWLHCANIWDKTYTTLNEVLADNTTLLALISSNNAVDYMVRSTSWASSVCANQTVMGYIGNNDYAADTLLSDSTWCEAICNSTYFESVLNVKVPTMTGYTTPSGQCFASSEHADATLGSKAWNAFDGNINHAWHSWETGSDTPYLGYKFPQKRKIYCVKFSPLVYSANSRVKNYKIQGSNDNSTWTDVTNQLVAPNLTTGTPMTSSNCYVGALQTAIFSKNIAQYQYYRILVIDTYAQRAAICNMQFYGR